MRFSQYLDETQAPEWKRAYIDYRKLKECINRIKEASTLRGSPGPKFPLAPRINNASEIIDICKPQSSSSPTPSTTVGGSEAPPEAPVGEYRFSQPVLSIGFSSGMPPVQAPPPVHRVSFQDGLPGPHRTGLRIKPYLGHRTSLRLAIPSPRIQEEGHGKDTEINDPPSPIDLPSPIIKDPFGDSLRSSSFDQPVQGSNDIENSPNPSMWTNRDSKRLSFVRAAFSPMIPTTWKRSSFSVRKPPSLHSMSPVMSLSEIVASIIPGSPEAYFFDVLDGELHKIEIFFKKHEREAVVHATALQKQLRELKGHRKLFHEKFPAIQSPWIAPTGFRGTFGNLLPSYHNRRSKGTKNNHDGTYVVQSQLNKPDDDKPPMDPDDYVRNKRKLKKAVLEQYRGLELLNNYRILNLTGFRKTLKKFEKVTKILVQKPYMTEKIDQCSFARGTRILALIKDVEEAFSENFAHGDQQRARLCLRAPTQRKMHHWAAFRTGTCIGLSVPAVMHAVYLSFQEETRHAIPAWGALLQAYGALFIFTLFPLLISFNILIWTRFRINYAFIFELDMRSVTDVRKYPEIPAFLFLTLSFAFWLSFARVGIVRPTTWPLIWIGFVIGFMVNPLPVYSRPARYWLIRKCGRLFLPGKGQVEFTDFWLGDQLCSLCFSFSSLLVIFCLWRDGSGNCVVESHWGLPFVLNAFPSFIRFVQCLRRYIDSRLYTHLINGGKYLVAIVYYLSYMLWKYHGSRLHGVIFILYCILASSSSIYGLAWDLLMDWSIMDPHAKHALLRQNLIYTDAIPAYYFAILSNLFIRFGWVWYLPFHSRGPSLSVRSFILACLEGVRRVQWNSYRVENEHLGNMDQYRVTREVPLPYSFRDNGEEDDYWEAEEHKNPISSTMRLIRRSFQMLPPDPVMF